MASRYATIQAVAFRDSRLSPRDITVLGCLGLHTDQKGYCHPSMSMMGRMLGISRQAVQKSIRHLEACGYLTREQRFEKYGASKRQTTNIYHVNADYVPPNDVLRGEHGGDGGPERPGSDSSPPCNQELHPLQPQVAPPATPEVAPPATPEVAPPATPEVAPWNNPDEQPNEQPRGTEVALRLTPSAAAGETGQGGGKRTDASRKPAPSTVLWEAYAKAYEERYQVRPIRNAKVNRQLNDLIKQVGLDNALLIAANFPRHPDAWYAKRAHDPGLMLSDAQKLLTEIRTGRVITWSSAKAQERVANAAYLTHGSDDEELF